MSLKAVVTGCDTHPVKSLALMLRSVGFEVSMLSDRAITQLSKRGYKGGVTAELLKNMGYVDAGLPLVGPESLETCDLYVDIKVPDADAMIKIYPRLEGKTVIFLINGGGDEYVTYGDHYPVITTNFHVASNAFQVYMPFDNVHNLVPREKLKTFEPPMGLLHNAKNWGFGHIMDEAIKRTGVRVFGSYGSPMGILPNDKVGDYLSRSLAFVHLKASDCPGYALYEAFATATPVVVTDLFVERMKYRDLYIDGETCLAWGKDSFVVEDGRIKEFMVAKSEKMVQDIVDCLERLKDPEYNYQLGMAGYRKWKEKTEWTEEKRLALLKFLRDRNIMR